MAESTDNGQRTTDNCTALFESGNSRLHFSWWYNGKLKNPDSIPYPETSDALVDIIGNLFSSKTPDRIAACSVSSRWREILFQAIERKAPGKLVVARTVYDTGINVVYDKPETIGVDRVLAAHAAYRFFGDSCVVIDAGTAVTVDAVEADGTILGGFIFPGPDILSRSLSEKTDLPGVSAAASCEGIGNSTETCISNALTLGFTAAVNELVKHALSTAENTDRIAVTGGGAEKILKNLPFPAVHKPYLALEGLGYVVDNLPKYEVRSKK